MQSFMEIQGIDYFNSMFCFKMPTFKKMIEWKVGISMQIVSYLKLVLAFSLETPHCLSAYCFHSFLAENLCQQRRTMGQKYLELYSFNTTCFAASTQSRFLSNIQLATKISSKFSFYYNKRLFFTLNALIFNVFFMKKSFFPIFYQKKKLK